MAIITGKDKTQGMLLPRYIDEYIPEDHPARIIEWFVEGINFEKVGIDCENKNVGGPTYCPKAMLKIILYAYLIGERASRRIERLCGENLAFIWLSGDLKPDYRTIARYRVNNYELIKELLKQTIKIYKQGDIEFDGVVYVDGTKIEGEASMKKNINDRYLKGLEEQARKILKEAEEADKRIDESERLGENRIKQEAIEKIKEKIKECKEVIERKVVCCGIEVQSGQREDKGEERKKEEIEDMVKDIEELREKIKEVGGINKTDTDSKVMKGSGRYFCGYNGQLVVDNNMMIVNAEVVNEQADNHQLKKQVKGAEGNLVAEVRVVVGDSGYFETNEVKSLMAEGKEVVVKMKRDIVNERVRDVVIGVDKFIEDKDRGVFICPEGKELRYFVEKRDKGKEYEVYVAKREDCIECPCRVVCCGRNSLKRRGRSIMILKDRGFIERYRKVINKPGSVELGKKRREKLEPVFGIMKRIYRFNRFLLRGLKGVNIEWLLTSVVYNIRRLSNIIGIKGVVYG